MARFVHAVVVPVAEVPVEDVVDEAPELPLVLVVDDEPTVADTLALILSKAGFVARGLYSARAALELAHAMRPSFLLTDVHMPGMNGVELAITLSDKFPTCEVLLFSGHATPMDLAAARAAGYDFPLLAKPVHPAEIVRHISKRLGIGGRAAQGDHSRAQAMGLTSSGLRAS